MTVWPDLRLAGLAAGAWLAAIAALYSSPAGAAAIAASAAAAATLLATAPAITRRIPRSTSHRPPARHTTGRIAAAWESFADWLAAARVPDPLVRRLGWVGERGGAAAKPAGAALRWVLLATLIGALCGATATAARLAIAGAQPLAGLARRHAPITLTLELTSDPHPVGRGGIGPPTYGFDAELTDLVTAGRHTTASARVFVLASSPGWAGLLPGQRLSVPGRLAPPDPGRLDAALVDVSTAPHLLGRPPWVQRAAGSLREGLQRACTGLPARVRGLLPGLIDGDTTRLDPSVADAFRATGMTHLLAVSGSNVAMIIGAVLLGCRWGRAGPGLSAATCAVALVGFVILVRPSPSVLRAAAMGVIGLVALASGRSRGAVPALAAVVFALIAYDPALATDIGFALSTFATAGLLLIAPHWRDALRRRRVPAGLAEALAVPAAAQVACSPLLAGISGTVSIVAVPANLLAVPAVPAATVLGVGAAVVSPAWPHGAAFLAWLASWPARWLLFVAQRGASAPAAVAAWPAGLGGALLLAVLLGAGLVALRHRTARLVALVALVAGVVGAVPVRLLTGGWPPAGALLVMCDVGQGDGLVLPVGAGRAIVVDSGPEPTAIDSCLGRLGVRDVPLLVLTHFHADHVGGVDGVLDGRRVEEILTSPFPQPPEGYRDVERDAAAHGIPVAVPVAGAVYSVGPARLTVLGPVSRLTGTRSDPNNNSLIVRVDEAGMRLLLTGDAEIEEQAQVLAVAGADALRSPVLKMPHHGSAYQDPAFLAAVAPSLVLVSVGAGNVYGLPSVPTLNRFTMAGARVMRTDLSGDLAAVQTPDGLAVAARGHPPGQHPP